MVPAAEIARVDAAALWPFILVVMLAAICGNIRMIALPTLVTALVAAAGCDIVNLLVWSVAALFTVQSSILLLAVGCVIWLLLSPYAEAAEQATLQKAVLYARQGRVLGFARSVEQAASLLTPSWSGRRRNSW